MWLSPKAKETGNQGNKKISTEEAHISVLLQDAYIRNYTVSQEKSSIGHIIKSQHEKYVPVDAKSRVVMGRKNLAQSVSEMPDLGGFTPQFGIAGNSPEHCQFI